MDWEETVYFADKKSRQTYELKHHTAHSTNITMSFGQAALHHSISLQISPLNWSFDDDGGDCVGGGGGGGGRARDGVCFVDPAMHSLAAELSIRYDASDSTVHQTIHASPQ
ncbi:unnamed protein product [Hydatigera taeniaeformis]|uniref:Glyco_hydro_38C domain-containing protein n=1 Tax=Hydatigena taeniaeformis TaxID=6205 RepID=A0A0R3WN27_HYDTA|nr:unnamed protein product [Hydatigera taeniaeformis]